MSPTETNPDRPADPRTERTCAAILDASYRLLLGEGPDAVTHGQVAGAAKVSRTTVYKHFPTRGELLRATIEVMGKPLPAKLTGHLRTDLEQMLADLVADLADERRAQVIATMIERAQRDATVAAVRDDLVREARQTFDAILAAGIASGELRHDIDGDLALSGLVGTLLFKRLMAGEQVDRQLATRLVDAFLEGHRPC